MSKEEFPCTEDKCDGKVYLIAWSMETRCVKCWALYDRETKKPLPTRLM